jgi:signal transduction histidine kinase
MPDYYHVPALLLIMLLLPAFGYLFLRSRNTRTLLWFLGFLFGACHMLLHYKFAWWDLSSESRPWVMAAALSCNLASSALFFSSLSPLRFRLGKVQVLYVIPFTLPLLAYAALYAGVFKGVAPSGPLFLIFPGLGVISLVVGLLWGRAKGALPFWTGSIVCAVFGGAALWMCFRMGLLRPLVLVETGNHVITVLLLAFVYRRFSPGVMLATMGFTAWSLSSLELLPWIGLHPSLELNLIHIIVMGKVVAAVGMILLALEDELATNKASRDREHRARLELAAYTNLILSRRRVEDFDLQANEICQTVVAHSRFAQAALLLLQDSGQYRVAGAGGFSAATINALDSLAARIPVADFLSPGSAPPAVEGSHTVELDLERWLLPGDDLKRLRFTSALAVPMNGRSATEGALILAEVHDSQANRAEPLRADDLLPIETLTARLQAGRSQTVMLEKLIDSEKFAGLGQLAGNVTQQLNNPLTVILGYASLLEEASGLTPGERKGVEAILSEARRMRSTLESLTRVALSQGDQLSAVSVSELLADLEHLHRSEFLHHAVEFQMSIAPSLPRALCRPQQVRQAILHCLQFAFEAVESPHRGSAASGPESKSIRLEATAEGNHVQILVGHSGAAFLHPERAFDPFVPTQAAGETTGLGLSLCATILRDNHGTASAVNLEPRGAAIILELQVA